MTSTSTSPYINTVMYTTITLLPNQMNNDLYSHLKTNVIKRVESKCFRHYGYIVKVYELLDVSGGMLDPENPKAAAIYNIKFSCRLCFPLKNRFITCKVDQTTQALTAVVNGPIKVILTNDRINTDKFITSRAGILVRVPGGIRQLQKGDHVKIRIDSRKFNNRDTMIMCMGVLDALASEEEIKKFIQDEFNINNSNKYVDYDKFIQLEEQKNDINLVGETEEAGEVDQEEEVPDN